MIQVKGQMYRVVGTYTDSMGATQESRTETFLVAAEHENDVIDKIRKSFKGKEKYDWDDEWSWTFGDIELLGTLVI